AKEYADECNEAVGNLTPEGEGTRNTRHKEDRRARIVEKASLADKEVADLIHMIEVTLPGEERRVVEEFKQDVVDKIAALHTKIRLTGPRLEALGWDRDGTEYTPIPYATPLDLHKAPAALTINLGTEPKTETAPPVTRAPWILVRSGSGSDAKLGMLPVDTLAAVRDALDYMGQGERQLRNSIATFLRYGASAAESKATSSSVTLRGEGEGEGESEGESDEEATPIKPVPVPRVSGYQAVSDSTLPPFLRYMNLGHFNDTHMGRLRLGKAVLAAPTPTVEVETEAKAETEAEGEVKTEGEAEPLLSLESGDTEMV
ncbi:hypothetical protein KIPB_010901, partial [Kipferlia bialata]